MDKPFLHEAYLTEITSLRDQLNSGLSGSAHESGNEAGPGVSEMAERIKTLKAAYRIEATPQRIRQKQSSAEEPITARIRRRTETVHADDPAIQPDAAAPGTEQFSPPEPAENSSNNREMTFQERIAAERRRKDDGPSPP